MFHRACNRSSATRAAPQRVAQETLRMRCYVCVPAVLAAGIGGVCLPSAAAGGTEAFQILWHDVDISRDGQTAAFTLAFNRAPSFASDDDLMSSQAFQYEIDADTDRLDRPLTFGDIDTVVRGAATGVVEGAALSGVRAAGELAALLR